MRVLLVLAITGLVFFSPTSSSCDRDQFIRETDISSRRGITDRQFQVEFKAWCENQQNSGSTGTCDLDDFRFFTSTTDILNSGLTNDVIADRFKAWCDSAGKGSPDPAVNQWIYNYHVNTRINPSGNPSGNPFANPSGNPLGNPSGGGSNTGINLSFGSFLTWFHGQTGAPPNWNRNDIDIYLTQRRNTQQNQPPAATPSTNQQSGTGKKGTSSGST